MASARRAEFPIGGPLLWFAAILLVLYFAQALLIPLAFALTLSFLLAPAVGLLERMRVPRVAAVALAGGLAFLALAGAGYVVSRQLINVAQTLPEYQARIHTKMAGLHSPAEQSLERAFRAIEDLSGEFALSGDKAPDSNGGDGAKVAAPAQDAQLVRVVDPRQNQLRNAVELMLEILRPVGSLAVVVVFTLYFLTKREELRNRLLLLAGMGHISLMTQALEDAAGRISEYLVMQFAVNAVFGVAFGAGLYALGVPNATLWGVIAGVLRIVPYAGTAVGLVLPLVVSVAVSPHWWGALAVLGLFLVLELSATNFLEPWLYSSRTGISSFALLVSAIFWALLWGWAGLVLSTPLTVCAVVLGRYVPEMSFLHTLLGTDAELSPEAHFYERLLAMDQREARAIADRFAVGRPLVELYDTVVIPALSLAEQDRHKGALDEARSNFLFLCIGELVAELSEYKEPAGANEASIAASVALERNKAKRFAVVCVSASDQADDLTAQMLAQLMEQAGHPTLLLSAPSISNEVLAVLANEPETVIFISALPPFAFSQARATCQRVRTQLKENRIAVGLWNSGDEAEQVMERLGSGRPDVVVTTLAQALVQVDRWETESRIAARVGANHGA